MRFEQTIIPGLVQLFAQPLSDERGRFVKTFERDAFEGAGLPMHFAEEFYSYSRSGVLRGLHFQLPPFAQGKTVFCEHGAIFDVVLDLRVGSPEFGRSLTFDLSAENGQGLYIPEGLAHGFCVVGPDALVAYRTTTGYEPSSDAGVLWCSAKVGWPIDNPVVSARDRALPELDAFSSPFAYPGVREHE